jgi:hypothetical protein
MKRITVPIEFDKKSFGPESILKSKSGHTRIYKGSIILTPGVWADSVSNSNILYKSDILKKYSTNWTSNHINLGHDNANPLSLVGTVQNQRWEDGAIKGDLYINTQLFAGGEVVKAIDAGLVNKLSIELESKDYWDSTKNVRYADDMKFMGVAIIGDHPACKHTKIR